MSTNLESHALHIERFESLQNVRSTPYVVERHSAVTGGPHLVFSGGVHGNERGGVEASLRLIEAIDEGRLRLSSGSLSFVLGNPEAYKVAQRSLDEDLNRLFTRGQHGDSTEGRRAQEVLRYMEQIKDRLAVVLDFHSVSVGDLKILVYNRGVEVSRRLASELPPVFDYLFGYVRDHLDGILSEVGTLLGKDGFSVECGGHESPLAADRALLFMEASMRNYGVPYEGDFPPIHEESRTPNPDMISYETIDAIRPCAGFQFTDPDVKTGMRVLKGAVFATGDGGKEYRAPQDCVVVMPHKVANVNDIEAGFLCTELPVD
ncbi:MAG: succinylglutamate desuccinylase/aspartoacylase family protein [Candidatus Peregrinibacteria bacterium]|nr:succinylglutamate desuccinylase/aspartoacylase family protein [Candidatus Peregrinibacteria bacterium]